MNLERFLNAQKTTYEQALAEIKAGKKTSHWIWWIFPQMKGLGFSYNSNYYGIDDLNEAQDYLKHPVLGKRLREATEALLHLSGKSAKEIFGPIDAMKVRSCMTLFNETADDCLFRQVITRYFKGEADEKTLNLIGRFNKPVLLGSIAGDVIGSFYERNSTKKQDFHLFCPFSTFTDDTVMTVAIAEWLLTSNDLSQIMRRYGRSYPHAGYGGTFRKWLQGEISGPYNSFGNGSAMRVSPVGWAFDTLEETLRAAKESAEHTHNHPEGIKGAQAVAACIYLARNGKEKQDIKEYIEQQFGYNLERRCDEIRPSYRFDVTCQGSVPESIIAFLESTDFESAVRLAVSLGGDADTMGAIAGGIAEAYYGSIPDHIRQEAIKRIPKEFTDTMHKFYNRFISPRKQ